jgi:hypothetical protein
VTVTVQTFFFGPFHQLNRLTVGPNFFSPQVVASIFRWLFTFWRAWHVTELVKMSKMLFLSSLHHAAPLFIVTAVVHARVHAPMLGIPQRECCLMLFISANSQRCFVQFLPAVCSFTLFHLSPCLVPPILPKFHYAKRRFPVISKCRQMHGVLNVDEIKN